MAFEDLKYAQRKRLEYLDRLFFWNGAATRASLIQQFGISNAQAALDFRSYLKEVDDDALIYDATSRQYLAQKGFQRLTGPAATSELLELFDGDTQSVYDELPDLQRTQNVHAFLPLYRAIRGGQSVEIVYQSMRDPEPETRMIAPLRFVSDGVRLHVRAYCFTRNQFRDFIPSRIDLDLSFLKSSRIEDIPRDDEWFTWSVLELRPHERLAASQQRVVRTEFGFTEDVLEIRIRQALEFYTTRRWGLDQEFPRLECLSIKHIPMTKEEIDAD
ncbi:WYL domain-containing protein [Ruegeria sp. EL01]|uniref:WYL domain-containing protein n=1 Tax=Ruegeria sp. EL01 TaxID=2107578 RepID=UPI000EA81A72|nr:WYL domain-containing protein [Ruegeria sp. EL01]